MNYARHGQIREIRGHGGTEPQAGTRADPHEIGGGKTIGGGGGVCNRSAAVLSRLGQPAQFVQAKKATVVGISWTLSGISAGVHCPGPIVSGGSAVHELPSIQLQSVQILEP